MFDFAAFGNDLYTGRRSYDFLGRRRTWYAIASVLVIGSLLLLVFRGLNPGIEFRGGTEFRVQGTSQVEDPQTVGEDAVTSVVPGTEPRVTTIGDDSVRVQTDQLDATGTSAVSASLSSAYGVPADAVTSSFVGPSWGQDVTTKAVTGLVIFLVLAALVLALYFRTWKMSAAAMIALVHDVVLTAGVYALSGFEVTPATVVGFLTILGYSLYDTVVVFDKIRENTHRVLTGERRTHAEAVNLAVNQTLVRSINTTVVALLPVGSILFIGAFVLGAGTLQDIALALFVGMLTGAYSSVFIAPPLYAQLVERQPEVAAHTAKVLAARAAGQSVTSGGTANAGSMLPGGTATAVLDRETATDLDDAPVRAAGSGGARGSTARGTRGPRNQPARKPGGRRR